MNTAGTTFFLSCLLAFLPTALGAVADEPKKDLDLPALLEKLKDKDNSVKRAALEKLARARKEARKAVPMVTALLTDKNVFVRIDAAQTLQQIDPESCLALPVLIDALRIKNIGVRCYACGAFRSFDPTVVPSLIALFREEDPDIHEAASWAIVVIGLKAESYLLKAQNDPDPKVREQVAKTLKDLKDFAN